jgi:sterol desaturase/sphingolipid hydroxylase (fatty acid hydroxylase superfamily)
MLWKLAEYLMHRFVYHKVPILRELHGMHHSRPCDYVGAPIWVRIVMFSSIFLLLRRRRKATCSKTDAWNLGTVRA